MWKNKNVTPNTCGNQFYSFSPWKFINRRVWSSFEDFLKSQPKLGRGSGGGAAEENISVPDRHSTQEAHHSGWVSGRRRETDDGDLENPKMIDETWRLEGMMTMVVDGIIQRTYHRRNGFKKWRSSKPNGQTWKTVEEGHALLPLGVPWTTLYCMVWSLLNRFHAYYTEASLRYERRWPTITGRL